MPHMRVPSESSYEDVADQTRPGFGGEAGDEGIAPVDGGDKLGIARTHNHGRAVKKDAALAHQTFHDARIGSPTHGDTSKVNGMRHQTVQNWHDVLWLCENLQDPSHSAWPAIAKVTADRLSPSRIHEPTYQLSMPLFARRMAEYPA
jgi:hypothetical protein